MGGSTYAYDGLGNRVRQTVGTVVTQYLLDLQPGLTQMLAQTAGAALPSCTVRRAYSANATVPAAGSGRWRTGWAACAAWPAARAPCWRRARTTRTASR
jgi:hypothetical protein